MSNSLIYNVNTGRFSRHKTCYTCQGHSGEVFKSRSGAEGFKLWPCLRVNRSFHYPYFMTLIHFVWHTSHNRIIGKKVGSALEDHSSQTFTFLYGLLVQKDTPFKTLNRKIVNREYDSRPLTPLSVH